MGWHGWHALSSAKGVVIAKTTPFALLRVVPPPADFLEPDHPQAACGLGG